MFLINLLVKMFLFNLIAVVFYIGYRTYKIMKRIELYKEFIEYKKNQRKDVK